MIFRAQSSIAYVSAWVIVAYLPKDAFISVFEFSSYIPEPVPSEVLEPSV